MRTHSLVVGSSVLARSSVLATSLAVLSFAVVATGCMERRTTPVRPRLGLNQEVRVGGSGFRNVDLLLVVDDSGSMAEEQENLAVQIPLLVHDLTSPPDRNEDGVADWGAADRVRIAVVNTDLGLAGAPRPTGIGDRCTGLGEDGAWASSEACGATPALQVFDAATDDADAFAARIGCLVETLGLAGCGIEQQLGAAARGVERGSLEGFPADDAIFAVLMLTDEEDCTLADPGAFFGAFTLANGNVLCQRAALGTDGARPEWLTPIGDLLGRMSAGRDEESFVFAAITGIPTTLENATPQQILADDAMQYRERAGGSGLEPVPACETPLGVAAPARRIVELASQMPGSVLRSICTDDFRPAVEEIVARIAERLPGVCLARAIPRIGDRVDCRMEETLPLGTACTSVPGRSAVRVDDEGREVCLVAQVVPGGATEGYFYDDSDPSCPQLEFTPAAVPPLNAQLEVDCYFEVPADPGAVTP